jgi:hypothetical protein
MTLIKIIFAREETAFFPSKYDEYFEVLKDSIEDKIDDIRALNILSIEDPVDTAYEQDNPKTEVSTWLHEAFYIFCFFFFFFLYIFCDLRVL